MLKSPAPSAPRRCRRNPDRFAASFRALRLSHDNSHSSTSPARAIWPHRHAPPAPAYYRAWCANPRRVAPLPGPRARGLPRRQRYRQRYRRTLPRSRQSFARPHRPCPPYSDRRGVTVLIVCGAVLRIGEHFLRVLDFLETRLGLFIVRIAVGVILHRELAIRFFDFLIARVFGDPQRLIKIPFRHLSFLFSHP